MKNIYDPEYVKKLFNEMSGSYERMNYITSLGFSIRWRKQFLNKLGKSEQPLEVIDLLSGLGENWTFLKKHFPNSKFHALDFSESMVLHSAKKKEKIFRGELNLLCEDILQNSLQSNFFDVVSCAYGLKTFNTAQLEVLAKEVYRILKPGGKFSFVEVSKPKNRILHSFYGFYLGKVIPVFGKLLLGNPEDYKMLWKYTNKFESCEKIREIFAKENLTTNIDDYFAGCATGLSGYKSEAEVY